MPPRKPRKPKPDLKLIYHDEDHAYYLNGKRIKGASSIGKVADDTYRLEQYNRRNVLIGCALDKTIIEQTIRVLNDATLQPMQRQSVLDSIALAAQKAAGANDKADLGTLKHFILEQHDLGLLPPDESTWPPLTTQVVAEWRRALWEFELEVVLIERVIVHPNYGVAGRLDRVVKCADGKYRVLDLKFGKRAVEYPHSMVIQVAVYDRAPLMAVGPANGDFTTTEFEPMPEMAGDYGYVFHMPENEAEIYRLDVERGWKLFVGAIQDVFDWRKAENLVQAEIPPRRLQKAIEATAEMAAAQEVTPDGVIVDTARDIGDPFEGLTEPRPPTISPAEHAARQENALESMATVIDLDVARPLERYEAHTQPTTATVTNLDDHRPSAPVVPMHPSSQHPSVAAIDAAVFDGEEVYIVETVGDTTEQMIRETFSADVEVVTTDPYEARLLWLRDDLLFIRSETEAAFADIAAGWPTDVPTFFEHDEGRTLTEEHLDRLEMLFASARDRHRVGFGPTKPAPDKMGAPVVEALLAPPAEIPELAARVFDEGPTMDDETLQLLRDVVASMSADEYEALDRMAAEAHQYGRSFAAAELPSVRRAAIMFMLADVILGAQEAVLFQHLEWLRGLVLETMDVPETAYSEYPLPVLLGCLTTEEAKTVGQAYRDAIDPDRIPNPT